MGFRSAIRKLRSDRSTSIAAVLCLAFCTGVNAAILMVAYGILWKPLPYPNASDLVIFVRPSSATKVFLATESRLALWRAGITSMELAGYERAELPLRTRNDVRVINVALVTDNFFTVLEATGLNDRPIFNGSDPTVVLSNSLARQLMIKADGTLPPTVQIGSTQYSIVAVVPDAVSFPDGSIEAWVDIRSVPPVRTFGRSQQRYVELIGRLRSGVNLARAQDETTQVEADIDRQLGRATTKAAYLERLSQRLAEPARPLLLSFVGAGIIIFIIGSANVANLLIGRTLAREREFATRLALGSSGADIVQTCLSEGLILGLAGSVLGAFLAATGLQLLSGVGPAVLPRLAAVPKGFSLLGSALTLGALMAGVSATAPAVRAIGIRPSFASLTLRARSLGARRVQTLLVVLQIALSFVLLTTAAFFVRATASLLRVNLGFRADNAITMELMLGSDSGGLVPERAIFVERVLDDLTSSQPDVAAGVASSLPPARSQLSVAIPHILADGRTESYSTALVAATPGFLEALGATVLRGRTFARSDWAAAAGTVAVVSRSVARDFFGEQDPIGQHLPFGIPGLPGRAEVVGVIADIPYAGLDKPPDPAVYVPWQHLPVGKVHLVVRSKREDAVTISIIRNIIQKADPTQPIGVVKGIKTVVADSVAINRLAANLATVMAALASLIASIGLIAVQTRRAAERQRELAIRGALGASRIKIAMSLFTDNGLSGAAGIGIGVVIVEVTGRLLSTWSPLLTPLDLATKALLAGAIIIGWLLIAFLVSAKSASVAITGFDSLRRNA